MNVNQKKAGVATLVSEKVDFQTKEITRDKDRHCKMINRSTH